MLINISATRHCTCVKSFLFYLIVTSWFGFIYLFSVLFTLNDGGKGCLQMPYCLLLYIGLFTFSGRCLRLSAEENDGWTSLIDFRYVIVAQYGQHIQVFFSKLEVSVLQDSGSFQGLATWKNWSSWSRCSTHTCGGKYMKVIGSENWRPSAIPSFRIIDLSGWNVP